MLEDKILNADFQVFFAPQKQLSKAAGRRPL